MTKHSCKSLYKLQSTGLRLELLEGHRSPVTAAQWSHVHDHVLLKSVKVTDKVMAGWQQVCNIHPRLHETEPECYCYKCATCKVAVSYFLESR